MPTITRAEWRWVAGMGLLWLGVMSAPYLLNALQPHPGWYYTGFGLALDDMLSYLGKMRLGAQGDWLFTPIYSHEPAPGVFMNVVYMGWGRLVGADSLGLTLGFHALRVALGLACLAATYAVLAHLLPTLSQRRWALFLVAFGGGLGWLWVGLGQGQWLGSLPLDFYSPETFTFLSLFTLPHVLAARLLIMLALLAYWAGQPQRAGWALLGSAVVQPLYGLPWLVVLAVDMAWSARQATGWQRWQWVRPWLSMAWGYLAVLVITFGPLLSDPHWRQFLSQNVILSPHPAHYLLAYGLWLIPAWAGWRNLHQHNPAQSRLIAIWCVLVPVLLYAPVNAQRRLIEGFFVLLVALAVRGLSAWRGWVVGRWPFAVAASLSAVFVLSGVLMAGLNPHRPLYLPMAQMQAYAWLARHAQPGEVGLSAYETGTPLPAYTPVIAFLGHRPETLWGERKTQQVAEFFQADTPDATRQALLASARVRWVLWGEPERALGGFDPHSVPYLVVRFEQAGYAVFEVAR